VIMSEEKEFYLGRIYDPDKGQTTDQPLFYDPGDLTTHAVVVGMTGSGKTGLCIDMLEEAALKNIPALLIDPKGDITNELLHFPDLLPSDFRPWVNPDQARRAGKSLDQAAEDAAALWKKGLAGWDIGPERLNALKNSAHFAIFTPGSDAGIPVSILASLKAPPIPWKENRELLREKISGTVTALLGLVGLKDIDPVRSREHILLANIFEHAWSDGRDLDLGELIMQTQNPPFPKLGVFDVNTFFPQKDRFELSMMLNNILAAPAFQSWIEGQPLDIPSLLFGPDGRPRHSVFYIAHLPESERMFFVTLLFSAVETWMRSQSGSTSLRAIIYFDEIFGYLPPIGNPPSKQPMLRMLKQARAFGVGMVLVTQNPVDLDYKALSNAGTWCIGKLQTEQDKERLLDGLEGATAGQLDRREYDKLISTLGKRVFLLHNVHSKKGALLFQTRWAMNYLTGPLTRTQIPALNKLASATQDAAPSAPSGTPDLSQFQPIPTTPQATTAAAPDSGENYLKSVGSATRPSPPSSITEYILPNDQTFTQALKASGRTASEPAASLGLVYRPILLGQAYVRFVKPKYDLDMEKTYSIIVTDPDRRGHIRWEKHPAPPVDIDNLDQMPDPQARFASLEAPLSEATLMRNMKKEFHAWAYRESEVTVRANETLKVYAGPDISTAEFREMCSEAARDKRDAEIDKVSKSFETKLKRLEDKMEREERELAQDEAELSQRKLEELGTHAEVVFALFSKRKRSISSSLSKRRMTAQAKADVEESEEAIDEMEEDIDEMEKDMKEALDDINERWGEIANTIDEISVTPYKKDVLLDLFGVAWFPYHVVQLGEEVIELPGYYLK